MADIRAIALRYADEVWNNKNLAVADELFTTDHIYHDPLMPDLPKGPDGVRFRRGAFLAAMPDAKVKIDEPMVDGDRVAVTWTYSGTNDGEIMGMPATGRTASITGAHFFRFEGDRIAETWAFPDTFGLMQQLGLVPVTAAA
jgi:steroid delta-isomerase-like uncharacterized protein